MYLTQMRLDLKKRHTLEALSVPSKFHGAIESAFSGARKRNLWRIDTRNGQMYLLILSEEKPNLVKAAEQFAPSGEMWQTKNYDSLLKHIKEGSRWRFRLCANPTYTTPAGTGKRGRVCAHRTVEYQSLWLMQQSKKHGFLLREDEFNVTKVKWHHFKKGSNGRWVTFLAVTYDGILEVCEADAFKRLLCDRESAKQWDVPWGGRTYDTNDFSSSDPVNQALSAGHACLYGVAHAVIQALGCSPGLGFVHTGHDCSFVYDIADLYKAEITIPLAFEIAATPQLDQIASRMRRRTRDALVQNHIAERMVRDIQTLLAKEDETQIGENAVYLWDDKQGSVENGRSYGKEEEV